PTGGESEDSTDVRVTLNSGGTTTTPGLRAEYFDLDGSQTDIPNLSGLTPQVTRVEGAPNYPFVPDNVPWIGLDTPVVLSLI
ncbi:hypothetical protein ACTHSL_14065, partial [Neisseria sp. P0008.S010]|uniref:hypothetical protein n=1 Tax=Neisseria sp. P0008.S010 TaxID=3436707 RepID=UPI003F823E6F